MKQNPVPRTPRTRRGYACVGYSRGTVDGISTHCGFLPPTRVSEGIDSRDVNRKCDAFFASRDMVWVAQFQDYLPSAEAFQATAVLAQNP